MQKILLILGVVCFQYAFGVYTEDDIRPANMECLKELNVDKDAYIKQFNDDFTIIEGNEAFNAVVLCHFRKEHLLKDDDSLDHNEYKEALITEYFTKFKLKFDNLREAASNAVDACKTVQGSYPGDTLIKHHNCIVNHFNALA